MAWIQWPFTITFSEDSSSNWSEEWDAKRYLLTHSPYLRSRRLKSPSVVLRKIQPRAPRCAFYWHCEMKYRATQFSAKIYFLGHAALIVLSLKSGTCYQRHDGTAVSKYNVLVIEDDVRPPDTCRRNWYVIYTVEVVRVPGQQHIFPHLRIRQRPHHSIMIYRLRHKKIIP